MGQTKKKNNKFRQIQSNTYLNITLSHLWFYCIEQLKDLILKMCVHQINIELGMVQSSLIEYQHSQYLWVTLHTHKNVSLAQSDNHKFGVGGV